MHAQRPARLPHTRLILRDRLVVGTAAAVVALSGLQLIDPGRADAAAVDGGRPQVIVPLTPAVPSSGEALDEGGSATPFSLKLPTNAACSGDSAADGYRVQSYIVPQAVAPSTLKFDANGPTPQSTGATHTQALFDVDTTPFVNAQTAQKDDDFQFGRIISIPGFALGNDVWTITELPAGQYNIGIACTKGSATAADHLDKFFNTVIEVVATPADPGGFTFTVPSNSAPTGGGTTTTTSSSSTSTTTVGGSTSSTTSTSTTSTTAAGGGAPTTSSALGAGVGRIPTTGSSTLELVVWGLLFFTIGRIFFLMRRGVQVAAQSDADWS